MKDIKPFYIYTDKDFLYIKNINGQTEKLSNNIHSYCATIDNSSDIHICALDTKGKLNHLFKHNDSWRKKSIIKIFNTTKNIVDMRLYCIDNFFNIFIVEKYSLSDNLYKLSHFNFSPSNYKICKYTVDNIVKDNEYFYKLNIDDDLNMDLEYILSGSSSRCETKLSFDNNSRKWCDFSRDEIFDDIDISKSNIKDDIFEYCYSIVYDKSKL